MASEPYSHRFAAVKAVVDKIKSEGIFDALRKECLADVDTKPAYLNLKNRVESECSKFLSKVIWSATLNKNQLREQMRKNLEDSGILQSGVKRIINQVLTPKIDKQVKPKVAEFVCEVLGLNPDEIIEEQKDFVPSEFDMSKPPPPLGLYPFNPYGPPPPLEAPPPLPGFDYTEPVPAPPLPPEEEESNLTNNVKQDDMDISDKSESRTTSQNSSHDMDMDMSSDEEGDSGNIHVSDLSKGLAAYIAREDKAGEENPDDEDDDMSIDSSEKSKTFTSEQKETKEEDSASLEPSAHSSDTKKFRKKDLMQQPAVERREMKRQRTRNKKYLSEDFTSIFTEKRDLLSDAYNQDVVEEEIVTTDDMINQCIYAEDAGTEDKTQGSSLPAPSATGMTGTETNATSKNNQAASDLSTKSDGADDQIINKQPLNLSTKLRRASRRLGNKEPETRSQSSRSSSFDSVLSSSSEVLETTLQPSHSNVAEHSKRVLRSGRSLSTTTSSSKRSQRLIKSDQNISADNKCREKTSNLDLKISSQNNEFKTSSFEKLVDGSSSPDEFLKENSTDCKDNNINAKVSLDLNADGKDQNFSGDDSTPLQDELPYNFDTVAANYSQQKDVLLNLEGGIKTDTGDISESTVHEKSDEASATSCNEKAAYDCTDSYNDKCESLESSVSVELLDGHSKCNDYLRSHSLEQNACVDDSNECDSKYDVNVENQLNDQYEPQDSYPTENEPKELQELPDEEDYDEKAKESSSHDTTIHSDDEKQDEATSDTKELERLAQKKLEILKAIELPDSVLNTRRVGVVESSSEEEEGEISDSDDDKKRKKKSKKSKKKKNKKDSKKRKYEASPHSSKRGRYHP